MAAEPVSSWRTKPPKRTKKIMADLVNYYLWGKERRRRRREREKEEKKREKTTWPFEERKKTYCEHVFSRIELSNLDVSMDNGDWLMK